MSRFNRFLPALVYLPLAVFVYLHLWRSPANNYLTYSGQDQNMFEWFFASAAKAVTDFGNPLHSELQNYPLGVNMMANTAVLGIGIPLAPITLLFGPTVTWTVVLTGGLAGTAWAWCHVMTKEFGYSRAGALIGGGFCGFAPSVISHGNGHPNFVALFVLPFIVARALRIASGTRPVRDGVILGLLVTYQIFIGEEPLLLCMVTLGIALLVHAAVRPAEVRPMLVPLAKGFGVAAGLSIVVCAVPLWWQFFGPQSYASLRHGGGNDVAALTAFATQTFAGNKVDAAALSMNRTEENAFFGWPLVVFVVVLAIVLWRVTTARTLAITTAVMALLSFGAVVVVHGTETVPGPWALLGGLPLFESVLPSRFAMACVPLIGLLLALGTDLLAGAGRHRVLWFGTIAAVLLPLAPTPLHTMGRPNPPQFFAQGTWRDYVDDGTVVVVPLPDPGDARALSWQAKTGMDFRLAEGYFVGPIGPERFGTYGAVRRPTSELLAKVRDSDEQVAITEADRQNMVRDLRYWAADVVVLAPEERSGRVGNVVAELLGRNSVYVGGVWIWDVRTLVPA
ncbi:glycosyl transferase [Allokutzneria sp. A3M-2-11 16]|uniref:glycosyl transferase n=1 Tax=Allokutzneria sp. A3M-2-11 16 TaxID=2962043 RepID=UPI0020B7C7DC|nr:glycosyl transferase [Allokutzneria sp. A3M-2-11 16]MCP3803184.1 glycosyl transferase [Allokutzneria sp. A3M-2-11 16]